MELTDIAQKISDWLESQMTIPYKVSFDVIRGDGAGACLRYNPAPYLSKWYIGGDKDVTYTLGYYFRDADPEKCRNLTQKVLDTLDGKIIDGIEVTATTGPRFIEMNDKGLCMYAADIKAKVHILEELEL